MFLTLCCLMQEASSHLGLLSTWDAARAVKALTLALDLIVNYFHLGCMWLAAAMLVCAGLAGPSFCV